MTQALGPLAADEKKLLVSSAFNGELATPVASEHDVDVLSVNSAFAEARVPTRKRSPGYPFVFFQGTDYTTSARIAMDFIWESAARARCVLRVLDQCIWTIPFDGGKTFLEVLGGTRVGRDLAIELDEDEASIESRVESYLRDEVAHAAADPTYAPVDWIRFGNTRATLARLGRSLARIRNACAARAEHRDRQLGADETLFSDCGEACVGIHGVQPFPVYGDGSASGMAKLVQVHDAARTMEGVPASTHAVVQYVYGYVAVATWRAAVEAALTRVSRSRETTCASRSSASSSDRLTVLVTLRIPASIAGPVERARVHARRERSAGAGRAAISISLQNDWLGW